MILVGIPCSGKSSYTDEIRDHHTEIISRDDLRLRVYGRDYVPTREKEEYITKMFNRELALCLNDSQCNLIILDNTHCKERYINEVLHSYRKVCHIELVFFDISLIHAQIRNILRRIKTGKWIPWEVMKNMHSNYCKLNREKYHEYVVHVRHSL